MGPKKIIPRTEENMNKISRLREAWKKLSFFEEKATSNSTIKQSGPGLMEFLKDSYVSSYDPTSDPIGTAHLGKGIHTLGHSLTTGKSNYSPHPLINSNLFLELSNAEKLYIAEYFITFTKDREEKKMEEPKLGGYQDTDIEDILTYASDMLQKKNSLAAKKGVNKIALREYLVDFIKQTRDIQLMKLEEESMSHVRWKMFTGSGSSRGISMPIGSGFILGTDPSTPISVNSGTAISPATTVGGWCPLGPTSLPSTNISPIDMAKPYQSVFNQRMAEAQQKTEQEVEDFRVSESYRQYLLTKDLIRQD